MEILEITTARFLLSATYHFETGFKFWYSRTFRKTKILSLILPCFHNWATFDRKYGRNYRISKYSWAFCLAAASFGMAKKSTVKTKFYLQSYFFSKFRPQDSFIFFVTGKFIFVWTELRAPAGVPGDGPADRENEINQKSKCEFLYQKLIRLWFIKSFFLAIFKRLYELPSNASVILKSGFENFLFIQNFSNKLNLYVTSLTLPWYAANKFEEDRRKLENIFNHSLFYSQDFLFFKCVGETNFP